MPFRLNEVSTPCGLSWINCSIWGASWDAIGIVAFLYRHNASRAATARRLVADRLTASSFITYLVPTTLIVIPRASVVRLLGLSNSIWSLVVTYPTFRIPFCTWMLIAYFKSIPKDMEECAMIDGCGWRLAERPPRWSDPWK